MKTLFILLLTASSLCGAPIDRERFLMAVSEIESGNNPRAIGRSGEKTQWQISPIAYRELKRSKLFLEVKRPEQRLVMIHSHWMEQGRVAVTVERAALCWHHGYTGAKRRKWKPDSHAIRTANIYNSRR